MSPERKEIFDTLDGKCFYCGCDLDPNEFEADHFIPRVRGQYIPGNLVPSCPDCNKAKSCMSLEEFREHLTTTIYGGFHGRLMRKYFGAKPQKIVFYFEKVARSKRSESTKMDFE